MISIGIVGDGIIGLSIALRLLVNLKSCKIKIFAKNNKYSGSLASGAMLNSFAETEFHIENNFFFKKKLLISKRATLKWKSFLKLFQYNEDDFFF